MSRRIREEDLDAVLNGTGYDPDGFDDVCGLDDVDLSDVVRSWDALKARKPAPAGKKARRKGGQEWLT